MIEHRNEDSLKGGTHVNRARRPITGDPAATDARAMELRFDVAMVATRAGYADVLDVSADAGTGATVDEVRLATVARLLAAEIMRAIALRGPGRHQVVVEVGRYEYFLRAVLLAQAAANISGRRIDIALGTGAPIVIMCPGLIGG